MSPQLDTSANVARQLLLGILAALLIWGIYLAVGSYQNAGSTQGVIVLVCTIVFLGGWFIAMYVRSRRMIAQQASPTTLNFASIFSMGCAVISILSYWLAIRTFDPSAMTASSSFGWIAMATTVVGSVASIVGLSNPRPRGGKLAGLVALAFFAAVFITFFVRSNMPPESTT